VSAWVDQIFAADQAAQGGVVRRSRDSVDQMASMAEIITEAQGRQFHVLETGDQVVILCHPGEVVIHC